MGPTISADDEVLLEPGPGPRPAEVWAFVSAQGDIVVHRCLWRRGGLVLFLGDDNRFADGYVPSDRLVGRATMVRRRGETSLLRRSSGLPAMVRWALVAGYRKGRRGLLR